MNTRRHPRTMHEAFPRGASYGCAIERPKEKRWHVLAGCFAIGVIYALIFFFGV